LAGVQGRVGDGGAQSGMGREARGALLPAAGWGRGHLTARGGGGLVTAVRNFSSRFHGPLTLSWFHECRAAAALAWPQPSGTRRTSHEDARAQPRNRPRRRRDRRSRI